MPTYSYPTNSELREIAQIKVPRLEADRPILRHFPIVEEDAFLLMWEQKDNYVGLQQIRGLNGKPPRVAPVGGKRFIAEPGVYGEFLPIDEQELTTRRQWGDFSRPIGLNDLVTEKQDQLLGRRYDRIEQIIWTLLVSGTFSVANGTGAVVYTDSYTTQTYTAAVTWATSATATPLANFRAVQLLGRGSSSAFDQGAEAWMNRVTFNAMIANTNNNDIAGRRTSGLTTVLNLDEVSRVLAGEGLPTIVIYDEGYLNDSNTFVPYIADNKVVVIGRRPAGAPVGQYRMVRNANNDNLAPGAYMKVIDTGENTVPRTIEIHDGHTGGPVLFYAGAIVLMNV